MFLYMFLYNVTIISLFWVFFSTITIDMKTLYSFSLFSFDSFYLFALTIFMFSLAGVPPFIGFFSKLFLINLLLNKNFYYLYFFLFVVLFTGLYFYIQNVRFLHSSNTSNSLKIYFYGQERVSIISLYFIILNIFFITNGVLFIDDFLLIFL